MTQELAYLLAYWNGRVSEVSLALDRMRTGPLSPAVIRHLQDAFYATNRAAVALRKELRRIDTPKRRRARRKQK